jgi:hypothetical protein
VPRLTIARRHGIGMLTTGVAVRTDGPAEAPVAPPDAVEAAEADLAASMDVPAFLRRIKQA